MKLKLLIIGFMFVLSGNIIKAENVFANDTLHWNQNRPLTWDDFKGESMEYTGLGGETACSLFANFEKQNLKSTTYYFVFVVFDKEKSWVSSKNKVSAALMLVQVMYHIYELHKRQLKKGLLEIDQGIDPTKIFGEKYNSAMTALLDELNEFKKQTKMGTDDKATITWNTAIIEKLMELEKYK